MRIPTKNFLKRGVTVMSLAICGWFIIVGAALAQGTTPAVTSATPKLSIPIPGVTLKDIVREEGAEYIDIPWLADYLIGVYNYLLGIAAFIAAVMILVGGFQWLTAGGSPNRVSGAKKRITGAVIGLMLAFGSYLLLVTVNPDLVTLKPLRIDVVEKDSYIAIDPGGPEDQGATAATSTGTLPPGPDTYDNTFKKYAGCAGIDWRILKAVAAKESAFRADSVNKFGFIGLFQTKPSFCSLKNYGRSTECTVEGLKNPDSNTASAAGGQLKKGTQVIRKLCPNISDTKKFVMLLYYGHNSGPGALKSVIAKAGCNATDQQYFDASSAFWANIMATKNKKVPNWDGRMQYAAKVANTAAKYGVTQPFIKGDCPLK